MSERLVQLQEGVQAWRDQKKAQSEPMPCPLKEQIYSLRGELKDYEITRALKLPYGFFKGSKGKKKKPYVAEEFVVLPNVKEVEKAFLTFTLKNGTVIEVFQ